MTFAQHWIRSEIQEYVIRNWRIVKLATTKEPAQALLQPASAQRGHAPLALPTIRPRKSPNTSTSSPGSARNGRAHVRAGDEPRRARRRRRRGRHEPLGLVDARRRRAESILEEESRRKLEGEGIARALQSLDPRSRRVIEARYLHQDAEGNAKPVTLQTLADAFGVSAERVRQIEKLAIQKMRAALVDEDPSF